MEERATLDEGVEDGAGAEEEEAASLSSSSSASSQSESTLKEQRIVSFLPHADGLTPW